MPPTPTPAALDAADPLAGFRDRFALPDGVIYLDGNSLGALPGATAGVLAETVGREWGRDLIKSWNTAGWVDLPLAVARDLAIITGCGADEIAVGDSISVNLFKLLGAARSLRPDRPAILADRRNFPTDLYIAQGFAQLTGPATRLVLVDGPDELAAHVTGDTAVVMASHVDYRSGAILDLDALVAAAHGQGALVLADLAHSAGVLPIELARRGIDMAVGCGYKYLNGGPGAPAFLHLARQHQEAARNPISGWFGHAEPFAFEPVYRPAASIGRFLAGTPAVLGMKALKEGTAIAAAAPMEQVHAKAGSLTSLFLTLFEARLDGFGFTLASPRDPAKRGAQLAFAHPAAYPITQALIEAGVIPDFRRPDLVRFGFAPLYVRHVDVAEAVERLARIMRDKAYEAPRFAVRAKVT